MPGRNPKPVLLSTPEGQWPRYEVCPAGTDWDLFFDGAPCRIKSQATPKSQPKYSNNSWSSRQDAQNRADALNKIFGTDAFSAGQKGENQ